MSDTTQKSDRPSRRVFTGLAIAAGGGVLALLVEYFVLQGWLLAPEDPIPWNSNEAPNPVNSVSAAGEVTHAHGRLTVTGDLRDRGHDDKGVLVIFAVGGKEIGRVANTDGANRSVHIKESYADTVQDIAVRECLTHQERAREVVRCSDPLVIWPKPQRSP